VKIGIFNQKIIHQFQKKALQKIVIACLVVIEMGENLHPLTVTFQIVVKIPLHLVVVLTPKKI
jgi:hypothetical protein